jgi:hypothetical protein
VICAIAVALAGRVYCDESHRWAKSRAWLLPPGKGLEVVNALATGRLAEYLVSLQVFPKGTQSPYCQLVFEVCTESPEAEGCCGYLSLKEISGFGYKAVIRQVALTRDEFRALQDRFLSKAPANASEHRC